MPRKKGQVHISELTKKVLILYLLEELGPGAIANRVGKSRRRVLDELRKLNPPERPGAEYKASSLNPILGASTPHRQRWPR